MKHYGNWRLQALLMAAAIGLILLSSEVSRIEGSVFAWTGLTAHGATITVKCLGLAVILVAYHIGSKLYSKGKLGNINDIEE